MECKNCMEECIGKTPCTACNGKIVKYVWLIPVVAFIICYLIGVLV